MRPITRKKKKSSQNQKKMSKYVLDGYTVHGLRIFISTTGNFTSHKEFAKKFNSVEEATQYVLFNKTYEICEWNVYGIKKNQWRPVLLR